MRSGLVLVQKLLWELSMSGRRLWQKYLIWAFLVGGKADEK